MANLEVLMPWILSWEGGNVNDPDDMGGRTNKGVTWSTYCAWCNAHGYKATVAGLQSLSDDECFAICKERFWSVYWCDRFESQNLANLVTDWQWGSGEWAVYNIQKTIGTAPDKIWGPKSFETLMTWDPKILFGALWIEHKDFYFRCSKLGSNKKYIGGWLRRLSCLRWDELEHNTLIPGERIDRFTDDGTFIK